LNEGGAGFSLRAPQVQYVRVIDFLEDFGAAILLLLLVIPLLIMIAFLAFAWGPLTGQRVHLCLLCFL